MRLPSPRGPLSLPALGAAEHVVTAIAALPAAAIVRTTPSLAAPVTPLHRMLVIAAAVARWAVVVLLLQLCRRFHKQSARLVSEQDAAVEGSAFTEVAPGVVLHHIISKPKLPLASSSAGRKPLLIHFAHGFGANALTWAPLFDSMRGHLERRSPRTALTLSAHDRLGFGLSPRPHRLALYGQSAGASFAMGLVESILAAPSPPPLPATLAAKSRAEADTRGSADGVPAASSPKTVLAEPRALRDATAASGDTTDASSDTDSSNDDSSLSPLPAPNRRPPSAARAADVLLVGHSLGGALAARMLTQALGAGASGAPRAAAPRGLVLIAPAILAPSADAVARAADPRAPTSSVAATPAPADVPSSSSAMQRVARLVAPCAVAVRAAAVALLTIGLQAAVRSLIFSRRFWRYGVGGAYFDGRKLSADMLQRYRWPAQVRGADRGVAAFVLAMLSGARLEGGSGAVGGSGGSHAPLEASDAEVVRALRECDVPILIIHGAHDRIVPLFNSRRLLDLLRGRGGGVRLVELAECGHCPQEECAEVVGELISEFAAECGVLGS